MKKATLQSLVSYLNGETVDNIAEIKAELEAELNKDQAKKDANAKAYDEIKPIVFDAMGSDEAHSATIAEIFEAIEDKISMSKQKVQYAITRLWKDEIVKVEGNPNSYYKA